MFALPMFSDNVPDAPPSSEPKVPEYESDEPAVIVDVATVLTTPVEPTYVAPCDRDVSRSADPNVDDAVEKRPLNPMTVDVEL